MTTSVQPDLRWALPPYTRGTGIAISSAPIKSIYPHIITVAEKGDSRIGGSYPIDIVVNNLNKLDIIGNQSLDFIIISSLSEDGRIQEQLAEYWRKLNNTGNLVIYVSEERPELVEAIQSLKKGAIVAVHTAAEEVVLVVKKNGTQMVQTDTPRAAIIRYGAYGDLLRASSVAAGLKKQGYHVTFHCTAPWSEVLENDPNIDEFVLTQRNQVANSDLYAYWAYQSTLYDKFVNLSESEEGMFLELMEQHRPGPQWGPRLREKFKNYNYLEFAHDLADLPHDPQIKFYPELEERVWAIAERKKIKAKRVILWQFEGSSVHKVWNGEKQGGFDQAIARILVTYPDCDVVITGGSNPPFEFLQWKNEPRVHIMRGKWNMRQTLTFCEYVDLIIAPETGVLTGTSQLSVPKIALLSHSTVENLTRDFTNTISLWGQNVKCKGRGNDEAKACHMIHSGWDSCTQNDITGTAECQAQITVDMVWDAIQARLK